MPVESDDDRLALLDDFGVEIEIAGRVVTAIFDDGYADALGVWVTTPVLTAKTVDFENDNRGDTLHIANVAYTIGERQPDGQGMSQIILQRT